jgi:hypothetical protein
MRPHKLLLVSATMLASTTLAGASLADDTTPPRPAPTGAASPPSTPSTSSASDATIVPASPSGSSSTSTSTTATTHTHTPTGVATPSTTHGTSTMTTTTQGTGKTGTTTLTSADDVAPMSPTVPLTRTRVEPSRDMTLYNKRVPNTAVLITGGSLLVGTYATTAALAATNGPSTDKDLYIPVVGPWLNLVNRPDTNTSTETRDVILIAGSGVLQGIGAAMAISSFFIPEKIPAARITAGSVKMNITPTAAPGAGGIGAVGTF